MARALITSAARHTDPVRAIAAARSLRRRELARIGSADLLGLLEVTEVCRALTSVWVAVLQAALDAMIRANLPEDGKRAGGHRGHRHGPAGRRRAGLRVGCRRDVRLRAGAGVDDSQAVRWSTTIAEQVRALLGTPSVDPPLEVDANLRPEGRSGPLVRTLASYEAYYAQWAQPWEIQALLRAHAVAGDADLGQRFLLMADKTRYPPDGVSAEAVREIRRIKARVESERLPRGADPNTHTKLGRGGLADIEWTVQLLQLRHAHEIPALHNTSTLQSLDVIAEAELVPAEEVDLLRQAWLTATRARNALVLVRGKPTDQLPGPGRQLNAVAVAAGWPNDDGERVPGQLPAGDAAGKSGGTQGVRELSQEAGALDAMFEVLSAAEADRVTALYAPLADAVRELVDATIRTEADDDVVATGAHRDRGRHPVAAATHPARRGELPRRRPSAAAG